MIRLVILFHIFFLDCAWCAAQPPTVIFDHYGPAEGFTTRTCRTVVKTSDGFVWISTNDGLVRFDSEAFIFYSHHAADSHSISSNRTDQLVVDDQDKIWVVAGSGLDCFDPATERFTHCFIKANNKLTKSFNPEALYYDKRNRRVWVSTWQGLYYGIPGSAELKKAQTNLDSSGAVVMVFNDITQDKNGLLWLCNSKGFFSYEPAAGKLTGYRIPAYDNNPGADNGVVCIYPDGDQLWLGTWTKGLVFFDTKTGQGRHYYYTDKSRDQNGITSIAGTGLKDEENLLWMSTPNFGLASFDKQKGKFRFYNTASGADKTGISGATNRLFPDAADGMWIAAETGLHRYDYKRRLFGTVELSRLQPAFQNAYPLENLCLTASVKGEDSACWFLVPYVGLYRYDMFSAKLFAAETALSVYSSSAVFAMYVNRAGVLWLSTDQYGLVAFDTKTNRLQWPVQSYFAGKGEWARCFYENRQQQLWIGSAKGLFYTDNLHKEIKEATLVNAQLKAAGLNPSVTSICEDNKGNLWFVCEAGGDKEVVGVFNSIQQKVTLYQTGTVAYAVPPGLRMHAITCAGSSVYIATESGLLKGEPDGGQVKFTLLTTADGLINNTLTGVLCDRAGRIWCATVFGISCYLPDRNFFINHSYNSSGLGALKNPGLTLSPYTGKIYITQQGAFNVFDPAQITVQEPAPVRFTGLSLFNQPFKEGEKIPAVGDLVRLRYNENMITVSFALLSFSNAENNQYAYRLEGLEKEWNYTKGNTASYAHLSPGRYTLFVKAANSSGVWTREPVALHFIIRPPFWRTAWFIGLVIFTIAAALFFLYRYRIRQLLRLQAMRNAISRNLHDEIGSTLTSISILSQVSQQAMEKEPAQAKDMLQKISQQSKTIQQNMSDIVWAIRSDQDRIESLLVRLREYAADTLEPQNITISMEVDDELPERSLTMEIRKEILLICKEALNNIAKHAQATAVQICLQKEKGILQLRISDNGKWKGNGKSSGSGLISMQQRAKFIGGRLGLEKSETGTSVLLSLPVT